MPETATAALLGMEKGEHRQVPSRRHRQAWNALAVSILENSGSLVTRSRSLSRTALMFARYVAAPITHFISFEMVDMVQML